MFNCNKIIGNSLFGIFRKAFTNLNVFVPFENDFMLTFDHNFGFCIDEGVSQMYFERHSMKLKRKLKLRAKSIVIYLNDESFAYNSKIIDICSDAP